MLAPVLHRLERAYFLALKILVALLILGALAAWWHSKPPPLNCPPPDTGACQPITTP